MGIDEHFFTRKKGYATTFVDLRKRKVFDVKLGRSELSLSSYLSKLRDRDKLQVMVMDLSETYRSIAKKYFPNATILADRFHVVRLINHHFLKIWKEHDEDGRRNRLLPPSRHTKNTHNHDTLTVRRLPICRNLLLAAPAVDPSSHSITHLAPDQYPPRGHCPSRALPEFPATNLRAARRASARGLAFAV